MRRRGLKMAEKFVHISPGFPSHSYWFSFYDSPKLGRASRKWHDGFRRKATIIPCHFISWEAELGRRLFYSGHSWEGAGMREKVKERRHGYRAPEKAAWGFSTPTYKFGWRKSEKAFSLSNMLIYTIYLRAKTWGGRWDCWYWRISLVKEIIWCNFLTPRWNMMCMTNKREKKPLTNLQLCNVSCLYFATYIFT